MVVAGSIEAFERVLGDYLKANNVQSYREKAGEWHKVMMLVWRAGADTMGQMASFGAIIIR